jgi:hypothetical protein
MWAECNRHLCTAQESLQDMLLGNLPFLSKECVKLFGMFVFEVLQISDFATIQAR